jgi:hypothetical protein
MFDTLTSLFAFRESTFSSERHVEEYNMAKLIKKEGFSKPKIFKLKKAFSNSGRPLKIVALGKGCTQTNGMMDDGWFWFYDENSQTYHQRIIENFYEEEAENL